jgi:hypothetical protein
LRITNDIDLALGAKLSAFGLKRLPKIVDVKNSAFVPSGRFPQPCLNFLGRSRRMFAVGTLKAEPPPREPQEELALLFAKARDR